MAVRWGSGSELARELGITRQGVHKAEKSGRITRAANGLFDLDAARIQFRLHTDPEQQLRSIQQRPETPTTFGVGGSQAGASAAGGATDIVVPERGVEFTGDAAALVAAKARREAAEADLAELELAEKRGAIMSSADHRAIVFRIARTLRDALLQVPARTAALLAAESDQAACQRILEAEIRAVLQQLQQIDRAGADDVVAG